MRHAILCGLLTAAVAGCVDHPDPPPDCELVRCKATIECQGSRSFVDVDVCNGTPEEVLARATDKADYLASTCQGSSIDVYCGPP